LSTVRVRVPTVLRELVAGERSVLVEVAPDSASASGGDRPVTVSSVLDALAADHPALARRLRDEQGRTRVHVNLFVGADNVRDRDGLSTTVQPGEELSIIPAISGG
jgi:molybdopterin converting factor small subunit